MKSLLYFWNLGLDNWDGDFEWWEWYGGNSFRRWWKRKIWSYTRSFIGEVGENDKILHIGCGSSPCINFLPGYNVGIDINPNKMYFLSNLTKAQLRIGNILDMETKEKFDVIIANEILEYLDIKHQEIVIDKISSMLEYDGDLVVSFPDHDNFRCRMVEGILHRDERIKHGERYNRISGKQVCDLCFKYGLLLNGKRDIFGLDTVFSFVRKDA